MSQRTPESTVRGPGDESLTRSVKRRLRTLVIAAILVLAAVPAISAHAVVSTFFGAGVTSPFGELLLGSHFWVSDHINGFCRLDPNPDGTVSLNVTTCRQEALAPTAPAFDPATSFVYAGDTVARGGAGVERYHWNPATELIDDAIALAPGANLAAQNPMAVSLAPDGQLYIGVQKSGALFRISNPAAAAADVPFQSAPQIGTNGGLRQTRGLTFVGPDLWISNGIGIYRIVNPGLNCSGVQQCTATKVPGINSAAGLAIGSDHSDQVWWAESPGGVSSIMRYTISTNTQDVMATQGTLPDGTTTEFAFSVGLVNVLPSGDVVYGDDPTAGSTVGQGRLWKIPAGSVPAAAGTPGNPAVVPPAASSNSAPEIGTGVTAPHGGAFITNAAGVTHFWVADGVQGVCRMDGPAADGTFAIVPTTCESRTTKPGQIVYDPVNQFLYVPDESTHGLGVLRFPYNPVTDTLGTSVVLAPAAGLAGNLPEGAALDPFDGNLYISFQKSGSIIRITTPAGAAQTAVTVGGSTDGRRVKGLAFAGPGGRDLWLAEKASVTVMAQADRCAVSPNGTCRPIIKVANVGPQMIDSDGADTVYWINQVVGVFPACPCVADVHRLTPSTGADRVALTTGVLPSGSAVRIQLATGVNMDPFGNLYVGDDPNGGVAPLFQGHVWRMTPTQADLALTMTGSNPFTPGTNGTFTLTATNNGPFAASAPLAITDTLPTGMTFVSGAGAGWTCTASGQVVTCRNPDPLDGAGATSIVTLTVAVDAGLVGGSTSSAAATSFTSDPTWDLAVSPPAPNNNLASVIVNGNADVSITGSATPEPVLVDHQLTYTYPVSNAGPTGASGVTFDMPIPAGVTFNSVSASSPQSSCSLLAGAAHCGLGSMASGTSVTVTVKTTPTPAAATPMSVTATVGANEPDPNAANNAATVTSNVTPVADMAVSTAVSPAGSIPAGSNVSYTITTTNNGPSGATGATLTDTLPAGTTFVSATPSQGTCTQAGATVSCALGSLASGAGATTTVVVNAPTAGTIANSESVGANELDPTTANNSATQTSTVV